MWCLPEWPPWMVNKNFMEFPYIISPTCRFISRLSSRVDASGRNFALVKVCFPQQYLSFMKLFGTEDGMNTFLSHFPSCIHPKKKNDKASLPLWPTIRICSQRPTRFIVKVMDILLQITWEASEQFLNCFEILPSTIEFWRQVVFFSNRKRIAQIELSVANGHILLTKKDSFG